MPSAELHTYYRPKKSATCFMDWKAGHNAVSSINKINRNPRHFLPCNIQVLEEVPLGFQG